MTKSTSPTPDKPEPPPLGLRPLIKLRPAQRRWPFALRASACTGVCLLSGWAAGDLGAGLLATLGTFTALYAADRPYGHRAALLAAIAGGFALAVWLGASAAVHAPVGAAIVAVAAIAAVATLVCNALQFGPPGAYMFVLAAAAGTFIGGRHVEPDRIAALTLAGGAVSWVVSLAGALVRFRAPEQAAVRAAGAAVVGYIGAVGTAQADAARHTAAAALHLAWSDLTTYQLPFLPPTPTLRRLRARNRALHVVFAEAMTAAARGAMELSALSQRAQALASGAAELSLDEAQTPLGRFGVVEALREGLAPGSPHLAAAVRVGVATLAAGALAATLGLERSYWAMATAALMLHQGLDLTRTLQRGLERTLGTWLGLALAAALLAWRPGALALALTLTGLQFWVEIFVVRNYALAVAFITPMAVLIATGAGAVDDVTGLLLARGVDTVVGCGVALAVGFVLRPRSPAAPVAQALVETLRAVDVVVGRLAAGSVADAGARRARRDLQHRALRLLQAYDESVGASVRDRDSAESYWPAVVATQRLVYRVLGSAWELERAPDATTIDEASAARFSAAIGALVDPLRSAKPPPPLEPSPFLNSELAAVFAALPPFG